MRALLLCALLLLAGCAATARAAEVNWSEPETTYLFTVAPALENLPAAVLALRTFPKSKTARESLESVIGDLDDRPEAPPALAVIDLYMAWAVSTCSNLLYYADLRNADATVDACAENTRQALIELARLYAARGSYPPGHTP